MTIFGDYLKEIRGSRSLREMEKITGLSHTYLSTLEKGYDPRSKKERKPTPEVIKRLAETLDENYFELMQLAGYMENDDINHLYQKRKNIEIEFEKKRTETISLFNEVELLQNQISELNTKIQSSTNEKERKELEKKVKSLQIKLKIAKNAPLQLAEESIEVTNNLDQINELIRIALEVKDFSEKRESANNIQEIHLENILSSTLPVYLNGVELNEREKEKVLQLIKLTFE